MHAPLFVLVPGLLFGASTAQPVSPASGPSEPTPETSAAIDPAASEGAPAASDAADANGANGAAGAADPVELSLLAEFQALGMTERRSHDAPSGLDEPPRWVTGQTLMQGYLGAFEFETVERTGGNTPSVDGSDDDLSQLPAIGGGAQWKLAGDRVDFGLEAMIGFGWRAGATAFATGGGGTVIAVDVDMLLIDLYGGPFMSVFLGERVRAYGAAGPLMQWSEFEQDGTGVQGSGSGFGTGWYGRTGLEFRVRPGLMLGGGVRWSDSTVDLDNNLGDLELEGLQWAFTVSTGI
jgi:hypothetical protein